MPTQTVKTVAIFPRPEDQNRSEPMLPDDIREMVARGEPLERVEWLAEMGRVAAALAHLDAKSQA